MANAARLLAPERLALELATMLHPTIPAPVTTLCLDLKCRPAAIKRAARDLTEFGVHATLTPDGWIVDPLTWRACQSVANDYLG